MLFFILLLFYLYFFCYFCIAITITNHSTMVHPFPQSPSMTSINPTYKMGTNDHAAARLIIVTITLLMAITSAAQQAPMRIWDKAPATYFEESMPLGNGKLGALVYGGTNVNTIQLNDITLWTGKPVNQEEDKGASRWIAPIREALFAEDYAKADSLQLHVQGHNSQFYQPLATLFITDKNNGAVSGYRRTLDLDSALCHDHYTQGSNTIHREYFASSPDRCIAIRLKSDQKQALNCDITLTSLVPHNTRGRGSQLTIMGHAMGDPNESIHFCGILTAKSSDGQINATDSIIHVAGATDITLYFVNETSFNGPRQHPVTEGAPYLERAIDEAWHLVNYTWDELRQRHIDDYRQFYSRMSLTLEGAHEDTTRTTAEQLKAYTDGTEDNPYLETLYMQFGRYLLISSSRTEGVPANLQGLWTPHLWSPWRGNYTVNINLEENYWLAEVANLGEMTMPLNAFVAALAGNGQHTAKNYYGIDRGWCSSHNSDIWAMTNPVGEKNEKPEWANWNMGGAWLVNTLWEHYLFSANKDYLRQTAYPLMKGAAEFCLAWLIPNPKNPDELITAPSTSPENEYVTTEGYHGMTCYGGTADMAIIRELLTNTLAAAEILKTDAPLRKELSQVLPRLHPYTIGQRGNLQEWYHDWRDFDEHHRHQSHLIGLYPGSHITKQDNKLAAACRRTLEIKGDESTGWSTGWRINLWARLHDGEHAYRIFRKLLTYVSPDGYEGADKRRSGGTYPNLFDAHPPFQIDGNFGGTAGVCEMLIQSRPGMIELLPALPPSWSSGSVKGLRARGGYEVDMTWEKGYVTEVTIRNSQRGKVKVMGNDASKTIHFDKQNTKKTFTIYPER